MVYIKAKKSGENLLIQVIDNGIGITEQRKEDIYEALTKHWFFPPNLVGIWTGEWRPAWSGDFTTDANINLAISGEYVRKINPCLFKEVNNYD